MWRSPASPIHYPPAPDPRRPGARKRRDTDPGTELENTPASQDARLTGDDPSEDDATRPDLGPVRHVLVAVGDHRVRPRNAERQAGAREIDVVDPQRAGGLDHG